MIMLSSSSVRSVSFNYLTIEKPAAGASGPDILNMVAYGLYRSHFTLSLSWRPHYLIGKGFTGVKRVSTTPAASPSSEPSLSLSTADSHVDSERHSQDDPAECIARERVERLEHR